MLRTTGRAGCGAPRAALVLSLAPAALILLGVTSLRIGPRAEVRVNHGADKCFTGEGCGACLVDELGYYVATKDAVARFCCGGAAEASADDGDQARRGPSCMRLGLSQYNVRPGSCDAYGNECSCCEGARAREGSPRASCAAARAAMRAAALTRPITTTCAERATILKKCLLPFADEHFAPECIGPSWQFTCCGGAHTCPSGPCATSYPLTCYRMRAQRSR